MINSTLPLSVSLAAAAIYGVALVAWLLIHFEFRRASVVIVLMTPLCLLLIPAEYVAARSLTAILCVDVSLKLIDYERQCLRSNPAPGFGDFVRFLVPFPPLLVVYEPQRIPSSFTARAPRREVIRLILGISMFALIVALLKQFQHVGPLQENFLLDHTVKFPMFIAAVEGLSQALCAIERLAGWNTTPIVNWSFLSRTPGEFWGRYNQRVHEWFYRNVFVPGGGIRHPVRGVVLVFLASAVLHEVGIGIATSRFDGYQFVFFAVQIPAVLASHQLVKLFERWGLGGVMLTHCVTVTWFFVTSILFFHGGNRALPWFGFYASEPWLP